MSQVATERSLRKERREKRLTMGLKQKPCLAWDRISSGVTLELSLVSHVIWGLSFTFQETKLNDNRSTRSQQINGGTSPPKLKSKVIAPC